MLSRINFGFVAALVKRDLWKYFTNPTGYVFITLFIFLSAAASFWQDRFFENNLANLDQLNALFPFLLIFFIPALTMSIWSEERKQGTDELLFTLPATSLEVVLGKYLAAVGIYSASLVLSLSHVLVLVWLGSPDLGLMFSNYVGFWLMGISLIAVGMLASLLTANATISFVVGAGFCAFFSFSGILSAVSETLGGILEPLGVFPYFNDFSDGVLSLSGILYFCSVTGCLLYLNVLLVERRHWPREADGYPMWLHHSVRAAAVVLALAGLNTMVGRSSLRVDVTAERLHSLSSETRRLLGELSEERPVFVQAYVSPEVPEQYVQTRANLLGLLEEIDSVAGSKVQVLIEETEPFTQEARDAREKFGIVPRQVPNRRSARITYDDVFLGVAFTSGAQEYVIPFLDRGLPAEYELVRSIRVVANVERKKIGVLNTDAKIFGGFDFQSGQMNPEWSVVQELKKQYEVVQVTPTGIFPDDLDGLLVALPSSMTQPQLDSLADYVERGNPTLLLVDPLPVVNISLAPVERNQPMNPFMGGQQPPPKEKGDIQEFLSRLGVLWNSAGIVWDSYNPHPGLAQLPPEVVFLGRGNENPDTFNPKRRGTAELQELVLLYPGHLEPAPGSPYDFQPLLRSGFSSGMGSYFQMVQRNFLGVQLNPNLPHVPDEKDYVLAAHVTGTPGEESKAEASPEGGEGGDDDGESAAAQEGEEDTPAGEASAAGKPVNLTVIADLDFISEQFFLLRAQGPDNLRFDNVPFFLNALDVLVGEESFVDLRSKRVRHRTLEHVEEQTRRFIQERVEKEQEAEAEAEKALADAQARLEESVRRVREREDLDEQTKQIMARNLQAVETRKFEVMKANIEAEKEAKISRSQESLEDQVRSIQDNIKIFAVVLPPVPVFLAGVLIFLRRRRREREGEAAARRLRNGS